VKTKTFRILNDGVGDTRDDQGLYCPEKIPAFVSLYDEVLQDEKFEFLRELEIRNANRLQSFQDAAIPSELPIFVCLRISYK